MWYSSGSITFVTGQTYGKDHYSVNIEAYTEVTRCLEGFSNFKLFELLSFFPIHIFIRPYSFTVPSTNIQKALFILHSNILDSSSRCIIFGAHSK